MGWLGYKGHFTETVSDPADDGPDTSRPAAPNLCRSKNRLSG
jgi:hypothetical protein